ncbi:MAG TPA: hypothetical protein VIK27_10265 [Candidatus Aquilonibacter sp.]
MAVFAVVAVFAVAVPVRANEVARPTAARAPQAKRGVASLSNPLSTQPQIRTGTSFTSGFLYLPGAQPGMIVGGRVNVGKSHVYVPYYGNISTDPTHPGVQGTAGIGYGFRTWDISLLNGGFGNSTAPLPGIETPKVNPALSLSIRF